MRFVTEEEQDLTLPEDSMHRARLTEIKLRTFEYTDKRTNEQKESSTLEWWWEITSTNLGPEYVGRRVKGECNPKLTTREGNRFHEWAQALLNRDIPVGMSIDTDDLVGLEGDIVIGHRADRKDPQKMWEFVSGVGPVEDNSQLDPPF